MTPPTLESLAEALADGRATSRALVEQCLAAISDPSGQGAVAFLAVDRDGALTQADAIDAARAAGSAPGRFAGIPVSIKDLFDVRGEVTRAGSRVLDPPAAQDDAPAVARLRAAGFVPIGRTNMSEFAFSGLGLNPHHGTPLSPWRRNERHIAGGSTAGGAVSVADGMAFAALGTDTGGSCRIPAAWCGLVGYKPTQARVPLAGAIPLSPTLDSIGPIARSVQCCRIVDAILAGEPLPPPATAGSLVGLRLLAPTNYVLDGIDDTVAVAFVKSLARLRVAGVVVDERPLPALDTIPTINAKGGFTAAESWDWHRNLLGARGELYDPRVRLRIARGGAITPADRIALLRDRAALIAAVEAALAGYQALVMPTVPIVPPRLSDLADDARFGATNLLALRNPTVVNMIDGCAISIPMGRSPEPPAGLMLAAAAGLDRALLPIAGAIEPLLQSLEA